MNDATSEPLTLGFRHILAGERRREKTSVTVLRGALDRARADLLTGADAAASIARIDAALAEVDVLERAPRAFPEVRS